MKKKTKKRTSPAKTALVTVAGIFAAGSVLGGVLGESDSSAEIPESTPDTAYSESAETIDSLSSSGLPDEELPAPEEPSEPVIDYSSIDVSVQSEKAMADDLKTLGLFRGASDTDYALDRAPTRTEAVVMLLRILGREEEILSSDFSHPFTDVPEWADPYIGYAYTTGLSQGVSETEFGTGNAGAAMYLTLVLRSLGYSDAGGADFTWDNPHTLSEELGILPERVDTENFLRGDVVTISHAALSAKFNGSEESLSDRLIADGLFTRETYNDIYYSIEELYVPEVDFIETLVVPEPAIEPEPTPEVPEEPEIVPEPESVPEPVPEIPVEAEPVIEIPAEPEPAPLPEPEPVVEPPPVIEEEPVYVEPEPLPEPTITIVHNDSSMTPELIADLENIAVFWAPSGEKYHIKHDCSSFKSGVAFAGTLSQAKEVRPNGWCGICSKGKNDVSYTTNYNATSKVLAECYTYSDYCNRIPSHVFNR